MADEPEPTTATEPVQGDSGGDRVDRLEDKLDGFIQWVKDALTGGSSSGESQAAAPAPAADIASEVQRGVERVRAADERKNRAAADQDWRASIDARLGKLENPERPPSELNPVGRFFGWEGPGG